MTELGLALRFRQYGEYAFFPASICGATKSTVNGDVRDCNFSGDGAMLTEMDQEVVQHCLTSAPRGWEDLVDRLLGVVFHVVDHTARVRQVILSPTQRDALGAEIFTALRHDNHRLLRQYRGKSSLTTYITIVARRLALRHIQQLAAS